MEFRIIDDKFIDRVLLSKYESMLWVDRYNECPDFELYTPPTDELLEYCKIGNYIYYKESEHVMIIEHVELTESFDEGQKIIIKGRGLESILDRRILWYKTQFRENLEDGIRQILDYSIINPTDGDRKIDNFIFEYSNDPLINSIVVDVEFEIGTDLLTVISGICKAANLGFKITLNSQNQFVFKLYLGKNHSYSQVSNPWIVFSPRFHNLITNEFKSDSTEFKNAIRTVGESIDDESPLDFMTYQADKKQNLLVLDGDTYQIVDGYRQFQFVNGKLTVGAKYTFTSKVKVMSGTTTKIKIELIGDAPYTRIYATNELEIQNGRITGTFTVIKPDEAYDDCLFLRIYSGEDITIEITNPIFSLGEDGIVATGLIRREYYNDASSVEYTEEMSDAEYEAQLVNSAKDELDKKIVKTEVNGSVADNVMYIYGRDYKIGDIVQVENEFGILGTMRVTEFITSHSTSGIEMYPTFSSTTGGEE